MHWNNAALTLKKIGYPRIKPIIPSLFGWLEDMCWPGSETILELLKTVPKESLEKQLIYDFNRALKKKEEAWIFPLFELMIATGLHDEIAEVLLNESKESVI